MWETTQCWTCPELPNWWIRHNEIRDITASLMTEVCHSVSVKPLLQPLTGEQLFTKSKITTNEARADIQARGFGEIRSNRHSLMSRFLTRMPKLTGTPHWPTATENVNYRRSEYMRSAFVKSSMGLSPLWSPLLKVAWAKWLRQAPCFIDLHQEITAIFHDNELDQMPDWIRPAQSNDIDHVPERSTIKCQSGCQK